MASYVGLQGLLRGVTTGTAERVFANAVIPYLVDLWAEEYEQGTPESEIVETTMAGASFLFDIVEARLIAAWAISHGKHVGARDKSRMAGHPLSGGPHYHRGHAIPHTLGGPTDINLVPQLGSVNVGAFRRLENEAVATPGALYFTHWVYLAPKTQTPSAVEQGLLVPGHPPQIRTHRN